MTHGRPVIDLRLISLREFVMAKQESHHIESFETQLGSLKINNRIVWIKSDAFLQDEISSDKLPKEQSHNRWMNECVMR